jgi:hypothetical protein
MISKFSLVIGIATAALVLVLVLVSPAGAVFPTVDGGDSGYADRTGSEAAAAPDFWNYDGSGQKVADTSPGVAPEDVAALYSGEVGASDSSTQSTFLATRSTSRDWPHPEIGAVAGIAVLLGLVLAARSTRIRRLAH